MRRYIGNDSRNDLGLGGRVCRPFGSPLSSQIALTPFLAETGTLYKCACLFAVFPREDVMPVMLILLVLEALEGLSPLTVPQFARARLDGGGADAVAVIERLPSR